MRAIIKFTKEENIRYISHLDILRMFQRAIKRADLPISYSKGFNPHMLISFACALPTGAQSVAEYADVRFDCDVDAETAMNALNKVMPNGSRILKINRLNDEFPSLMAVVSASEYRIDIKEKSADKLIAELIEQVNDAREIIIDKKTKKGIKATDIRPMIKEISYENMAIRCKLDAGNNANLRPDSLMNHLSEMFECFPEYTITRTALYVNDGNGETDLTLLGGNV